MLSRPVRAVDGDVLEEECRRAPGFDFRSVLYRSFRLTFPHRVYQESAGGIRGGNDAEYGPVALGAVHTDGMRVCGILDAPQASENQLSQ